MSARGTHSRRSRLAPGPAVAARVAASAPVASSRSRLVWVGPSGTRAPAAPQPPSEPSRPPRIILVRPDSAREDGGPRATGAESPAGGAGGALRRHGRGHEEREFPLPSPPPPPRPSPFADAGLHGLCPGTSRPSATAVLDAPEGTGEGPENTEDQVCDAASPRASPRAGGPAASALPARPGWGGVFSGLGSGAGSPAAAPSGRLGDLSGGPCASFVPHFPLLPEPGRVGAGDRMDAVPLFSPMSGRRLSHSLSRSPGFLILPPATHPTPQMFPLPSADRSFKASSRKNVGSPENLDSMVQNRNLLAHVFLNKRLPSLHSPKQALFLPLGRGGTFVSLAFSLIVLDMSSPFFS